MASLPPLSRRSMSRDLSHRKDGAPGAAERSHSVLTSSTAIERSVSIEVLASQIRGRIPCRRRRVSH